MQNHSIPQDDLTDVIEMTDKIEHYVNNVLQECDVNLAMSALIGAFINCTLDQCEDSQQIIKYRNAFVLIFDESIKRYRKDFE